MIIGHGTPDLVLGTNEIVGVVFDRVDLFDHSHETGIVKDYVHFFSAFYGYGTKSVSHFCSGQVVEAVGVIPTETGAPPGPIAATEGNERLLLP